MSASTPLTAAWSRRLRGLLVWLPMLVALIASLSGLGAVAIQQSATTPDPVIRDASPPTAVRDVLIDLNTATAAELATLPGIGATRADAIVQLRAQRPFRSLSDLVDRGVLRPSQLLAIADLATVYVALD